MKSKIPSDLLKLKRQFDRWRKTRIGRSRIPDHLRVAAIGMLDRCSASTISRVCGIHFHTLQKAAAPKTVPANPAISSPPFFALPQALFPDPRPARAECRLVLERPDGAKLTIDLPVLDADSISSLCSDFLRP